MSPTGVLTAPLIPVGPTPVSVTEGPVVSTPLTSGQVHELPVLRLDVVDLLPTRFTGAESPPDAIRGLVARDLTVEDVEEEVTVDTQRTDFSVQGVGGGTEGRLERRRNLLLSYNQKKTGHNSGRKYTYPPFTSPI